MQNGRVKFQQSDTQLKSLLSERAAESAFTMLAARKTLQSGSGKFTHKCSCPSPAHKGGGEKTASFYFSRATGQFFCFGCNIYGNAFDLIAMLGGSSETALESAIQQGPIAIPDTPNMQRLIGDHSRKLIKKCRQKLTASYGTRSWEEDFKWMQSFYEKLDKILPDMESESAEQVHGRFLQFNMELNRRFK
jgi:hypothetical protein